MTYYPWQHIRALLSGAHRRAEQASSRSKGLDLLADAVHEGLRGQLNRCPSCEHRALFHQPEGCWYSVTDAKPGTTVGCNCIGWKSAGVST